jgi:FkbM family methyltransferase
MNTQKSIIDLYRKLPIFKGKQRLGSMFFPFPATDHEKECLELVDMRDGSKFLIDLRCPTERDIYFTGGYDYFIINRLLDTLEIGSTILDVGANVGFYTVALGNHSKKAFQNYTIHAFEPVKVNFDRLLHNIELNELQQQDIHMYNTALGNEEGRITLQIGTNSELSSTNNAMWIKGEIEKNRGLSCSSEITKLDTFAQQNELRACDLIKVDIEGAELEFLLGGKDFINCYRPIILSEFNPYCAKQFGYSFKEICELASDWEYELYKQKGRKNFVNIDENYDLFNLTNFLMVPLEKPREVLIKLGINQVK